MSRRWSQPTECGTPEWKDTKRGRRCAAICKDGRWKFVKKSACEGGGDPEGAEEDTPTHPEVMEFSGPVGLVGPLEIEPIQPMPLFPLVGPVDTGERPRRRRRRRRG